MTKVDNLEASQAERVCFDSPQQLNSIATCTRQLSTGTSRQTYPSDISPATRVHLDSPQQLAGSSRQYESDDTCIQQYESDSSLQSDSENSETDEDTSQQHSIASSTHQSLNFYEMYREITKVSPKWYNLGLEKNKIIKTTVKPA